MFKCQCVCHILYLICMHVTAVLNIYPTLSRYPVIPKINTPPHLRVTWILIFNFGTHGMYTCIQTAYIHWQFFFYFHSCIPKYDIAFRVNSVIIWNIFGFFFFKSRWLMTLVLFCTSGWCEEIKLPKATTKTCVRVIMQVCQITKYTLCIDSRACQISWCRKGNIISQLLNWIINKGLVYLMFRYYKGFPCLV